MRLHFKLPDPPPYVLEVVEDRSPPKIGFLKRVSRLLRIVAPDGSSSAEFVYDEVDRLALDAVVIAPHFLAANALGVEECFVILRSALRPPVALRNAKASPLVEEENRGLWEFPAGLIEAHERSLSGVRRAGARELLEETGFRVSPDDLRSLGPSSFPAPGICAERHFYFHVVVEPQAQEKPSLDGSPLEEAFELIALSLTAALKAAAEGKLQDAKTELALRRLQEEIHLEPRRSRASKEES